MFVKTALILGKFKKKFLQKGKRNFLKDSYVLHSNLIFMNCKTENKIN